MDRYTIGIIPMNPNSTLSDGFVILGKVELPATNVFLFYYKRNHLASKELLGRISGTVQCPVFSERLVKMRAKLQMIYGQYVHQDVVNIDEVIKEQKRLSDKQRYNRKMGMLMREYYRRKQEIENSSNLFKDSLIDELNKDLDRAIIKCKEIYHVTD